jgi:outer membrane protein OmpA-like peptidoglycan-associated protein
VAGVVDQVQRRQSGSERGVVASPPERQSAVAGPTTAVFFTKGKHTLLVSQREELERILLIASDPQCMITLAGHASTEGPHRLNQQLSEQRAAAVAEFLADNGVERRRIRVTAFGKRAPAVSEEAESEQEREQLRSENRRVEVTFQRPGGANRRLVDLQTWVNKTRGRLKTNLETDQRSLDAARRHLAKILARVAWSPILRADAELWAADAERNVEASQQLLDDLTAVAGDPVKAAAYFRRRRDTRWMIDRKRRFVARKMQLLERAEAERARATTERDRDACDELIDFYRGNIEASREEILRLQADLAFGSS